MAKLLGTILAILLLVFCGVQIFRAVSDASGASREQQNEFLYPWMDDGDEK